MSTDAAYTRYAIRIALQAEAELAAKPKPIVVVIEEPPEPALTRDCFDPIPTLH